MNINSYYQLPTVHFGTAQKYYGTHISRLSELHHAVSGDVFAVDSRTLFIKGFTYDGEGPAAYFYVGNSRAPTNQGGVRIRDERGGNGVLKRYRNKDITLTLPEGKTLLDIKWFSVWCDEFSVDFGSVVITKNLDFPRPQKIGGLKGIHAVQSDNIVIVDAQTLLIPNFSYDGVAPGDFLQPNSSAGFENDFSPFRCKVLGGPRTETVAERHPNLRRERQGFAFETLRQEDYRADPSR